MSRKFSDGKSGAAIAVKVTPRAKQNQVVKILEDNSVKIKLRAAPVDGKANIELIKYLAKVLNIRKSNLEILVGETSRNKLISVYGLTNSEINKRLISEIEKGN